MSAESTNHLVIGGGLPGIITSLTLSGLGHKVTLIDAAPSIGGLLNSYTVGEHVFDYGTHFASSTNNTELDAMLFGGFEDKWNNFDVLKAGNYFNGCLNAVSDNPDLTSLPQAIHDKCLSELLAGREFSSDYASAKDLILDVYGSCLLDNFYDPVFSKLCGLSASDLNPQVLSLFNLKRFAVLSSDATAQLKLSSVFDSKVSFHHRDAFSFHKPCLYPRAGGIGLWIHQLESKLIQSGVNIVKDAHIQDIQIVGNKIKSVMCLGNELIPESVFWSISPSLFCKISGIELKHPFALNCRSTVLVGLIYDRPALSDCHYITNYDPSLASFRVTVYENFRDQGTFSVPSERSFTVEFLVDPLTTDSLDWLSLADSELKDMGIVSKSAVLLSSHFKVIPNGFPVHTVASSNANKLALKELDSFDNLYFIGRASGRGWFMHELLINSFELVNQIF